MTTEEKNKSLGISHRYSYLGLGANTLHELKQLAKSTPGYGHFYRDVVRDHWEEK